MQPSKPQTMGRLHHLHKALGFPQNFFASNMTERNYEG